MSAALLLNLSKKKDLYWKKGLFLDPTITLERILVKQSLPYWSYMFFISFVVPESIYGNFMDFSGFDLICITYTVEAVLTDTLVSGKPYLRPPSQNAPFFSTPIQTLVYFYIPVSGQLQLWTPFSRDPDGVRLRGLPLYRKIPKISSSMYKPLQI